MSLNLQDLDHGQDLAAGAHSPGPKKPIRAVGYPVDRRAARVEALALQPSPSPSIPGGLQASPPALALQRQGRRMGATAEVRNVPCL